MKYTLPSLPFGEDALAPVISKKTIEYHYGKHEKTYIENLNRLIKGTEFEDMELEDVIVQADGPVYNNASGYVHFSEKGFYQSVSALEGEYEIGIQVSHAIPEKANDFILECVQAYIFVLELFYSMFKDIIRVKKEYDHRHKEV